MKLKGADCLSVFEIQIREPDRERICRINCVAPKIARNNILPSITINICKVGALPETTVLV